MRRSCLMIAGLVLSGCVTTPVAITPKDFNPISTTRSPNARLYADCIAQAADAGRYGHAVDEVHVVVFVCEGAPAQVFFDALATWSAENGSEIVADRRTIRATTQIERDLFAADYCENEGAAYRCAISLRTGAFAQP